MLESCFYCGATHTIILNKDELFVCTNCGTVQQEQFLTHDIEQLYVGTKDWQKSTISKFHNELTSLYSCGTFFKSKQDNLKKLSKIQKQTVINSNFKIHRIILKLSELNSIFQFTANAKYEIIAICQQINKYVDINARYIDRLIISILFYYRKQGQSIDLKEILRRLTKAGYDVSFKKLARILLDIPNTIKNSYTKISIQSIVDYCISNVYAFIERQYNISALNLSIKADELRKKIINLCQLKKQIAPTNNKSIKAFIIKIIYDEFKKLRLESELKSRLRSRSKVRLGSGSGLGSKSGSKSRVRSRSRSILTLKNLEQIFGISEISIRNSKKGFEQIFK